jgi:hypothetical protein
MVDGCTKCYAAIVQFNIDVACYGQGEWVDAGDGHKHTVKQALEDLPDAAL